MLRVFVLFLAFIMSVRPEPCLFRGENCSKQPRRYKLGDDADEVAANSGETASELDVLCGACYRTNLTRFKHECLATGCSQTFTKEKFYRNSILFKNVFSQMGGNITFLFGLRP
jgi:hypothetical protein